MPHTTLTRKRSGAYTGKLTDMRRWVRYFLIISCASFAFACSCDSDDNRDFFVKEGKYGRANIISLPGFEEEKDAILSDLDISEEEFISWSTDSAWSLMPAEQERLIAIRNNVSKPDTNTLLQKVIPLDEIAIYMNNVYGGTIGGFICEAADVKRLCTMKEVFCGLRLDYEGTKFAVDGAGYAVIRFYSTAANGLIVPYSPELGGNQPHAWPNGGGGFTTSTLGDGGYPEWVMTGYTPPCEGAELYEVTPAGREILRSVYKGGKWQTYESAYFPLPAARCELENLANIQLDNKWVTTYGDYEGHTYLIRGNIDGLYHLRTFTQRPGLRVIEKGVYGIDVPVDEVYNIRKVINEIY